MDQLSESSRRAFLAALAASGVGAAALAAPGVAHAQGITGQGVVGGTTETFHTDVFPTPTPGTTYLRVLGGDFQPISNLEQFDKFDGQVESTIGTPGFFYFSLSDLPQGARVTEITFAVVKSAPFYLGAGSYVVYQMTSPVVAQLADASNVGLPVQAAEQHITPAIDQNDQRWVVDSLAPIWIVLQLTKSRVNSVRVGYVAPPVAASFFPIAPKRVYDSRFVAPLGPLASSTNRVVSVANGYATDSATLDLPNVVPPGATAIAYNVTIANTAGAGYLSVNPGDAAALGGSSINWFTSGLSLANGLVVKLDANRQIKVFCGPGGGSADFIIDILGYYL